LISVGFKCGTLFLPESPEVCQSYFCSVWQSLFESHETLKCRNILPGVELAVTPEFQRGSLPLATDQALKEFIGAARNLRDSEILESQTALAGDHPLSARPRRGRLISGENFYGRGTGVGPMAW